jgi:hypothetical protein
MIPYLTATDADADMKPSAPPLPSAQKEMLHQVMKMRQKQTKRAAEK